MAFGFNTLKGVFQPSKEKAESNTALKGTGLFEKEFTSPSRQIGKTYHNLIDAASNYNLEKIQNGAITTAKIDASAMRDHLVTEQTNNLHIEVRNMAKKIQLTPEQIEDGLYAFDKILAVAQQEDMIFSVDGVQKITVKLHDGTFRVKSSEPDMEFFLDSAYYGASQEMILVMACVDSTSEYSKMEVKMSKADEMFPLMASAIAGKMDHPRIEKLDSLFKALIAKEKKEREKIIQEDENLMKDNPLWGRF